MIPRVSQVTEDLGHLILDHVSTKFEMIVIANCRHYPRQMAFDFSEKVKAIEMVDKNLQDNFFRVHDNKGVFGSAGNAECFTDSLLGYRSGLFRCRANYDVYLLFEQGNQFNSLFILQVNDYEFSDLKV